MYIKYVEFMSVGDNGGERDTRIKNCHQGTHPRKPWNRGDAPQSKVRTGLAYSQAMVGTVMCLTPRCGSPFLRIFRDFTICALFYQPYVIYEVLLDIIGYNF